MSKKGKERMTKTIVISMTILILISVWIALHPKPTGDWEVLYTQLGNKTAGFSPAIGLGSTDPLTDMIVPPINETIVVEFLVVARNVTGDRIDPTKFGYIADSGLYIGTMNSTKVNWAPGWDMYILNLEIRGNEPIVYRLTILAGNERGDTSSRLFLVTPMW